MNAVGNGTSADQARAWLPKLNGEDQAQILAILALAEAAEHIAGAIDNLSDEVRSTGTQAHPIHVEASA